ncbi:MAG TPA: hypothetical protein VFF72_04010, partial [Caldimonas sp.]|nr:hypothetical protein [Caldimonas sp.]
MTFVIPRQIRLETNIVLQSAKRQCARRLQCERSFRISVAQRSLAGPVRVNHLKSPLDVEPQP